MFGLIVLITLVVVFAVYAVEMCEKLNKSGKLSLISYSKAEANTKCTIDDYKYFELDRK